MLALKLIDVELVLAASLIVWLFLRVLNCASHHQSYECVCFNCSGPELSDC